MSNPNIRPGNLFLRPDINLHKSPILCIAAPYCRIIESELAGRSLYLPDEEESPVSKEHNAG